MKITEHRTREILNLLDEFADHTGGDAKVEPARNNPYALAQQPASSAPDPTAGDAVAMQPVAEVAMSDDGYKIGLLGPLRAHRLPLGTKLYASPRAAISGANAPVRVEAALSLLRAGHWREVHVGRRYMRLEVTYDYAAWERLMEQVEAALAQQPSAEAQVGGEVEYEFEVWQDESLQAGGSTSDYATAKSEADHYALMYGQDGPVEVRMYEKRRITAPPSAPVGVEDWLIGVLMEAEEGGHTAHTPAELCGLAAKALKSLIAQQPGGSDNGSV